MSDLVYPQLTQLPLVKRLRRRTVVNRTADDREIKIGDPAGEITEWDLRYQDLTDVEAEMLRQFFETTEGALLPFTFVDPTANLLAETARLNGSKWTRDPLLQVTGGPLEWHLENRGGAAQGLWQDIGGPSGFQYCLSVFARADVRCPVTLRAGSTRAERPVTNDWQRLRVAVAADTTRFGVELGAGAAVDIRGLQVEAQAGTSTARAGTRGGVFANAHFENDELEMVATGPNRHSCAVSIVHAIHI